MTTNNFDSILNLLTIIISLGPRFCQYYPYNLLIEIFGYIIV